MPAPSTPKKKKENQTKRPFAPSPLYWLLKGRGGESEEGVGGRSEWGAGPALPHNLTWFLPVFVVLVVVVVVVRIHNYSGPTTTGPKRW